LQNLNFATSWRIFRRERAQAVSTEDDWGILARGRESKIEILVRFSRKISSIRAIKQAFLIVAKEKALIHEA
jgi:hypothetical protein